MQVKRSELMRVLRAVKPGVAVSSKKDMVAQSGHFIFTGTHIATFNQKVSVTYPFTSDIVFSVPAVELFSLVNNIGGEEIDLSLNGNTLIIESEVKKSKAGLVWNISDDQKVEDHIEILQRSMRDWKPVPEDFAQGLFMTSFSASKDRSLQHFCCVNVNGDDIQTCDRYRASWYKMQGTMDPFMIFATDAEELAKYIITHYCIGDNWVNFKTDEGATFSCGRYYATEYESIEELFSVEGPSLTLPPEVEAAIAEVQILAEGENEAKKSIKLSTQEKCLIIRAEKEIGWAQKIIDIPEYTGPAFSFSINPKLFKQILDKMTVVTVGTKRLLFTSENFFHILSLAKARN